MSREGWDGGACGVRSPICPAATPVEVEGPISFFPESLRVSGRWSGSPCAHPECGRAAQPALDSKSTCVVCFSFLALWGPAELAGGGVLTALG